MSQITMWDRSLQYKQDLLVSYYDALKATKRLFEQLASGEKVPFVYVETLVDNFLKSLVIDKAVLLNLASIRVISEKEDYLFSHALNVCLIALNIAAAQGYNQDQVLEIGESALLSDVGMMLVPRAIRFKKGKLEEEEVYEIRKHPVLACQLLESVEGIPESVIVSAYQHHERQSGMGYPKKRQGRFIHQYAQLVSIADVYEAISSRRNYRNAHIPYHAMEMVLKMTNKGYLNNEKVRKFIQVMSLFPIGSLVQLISGRLGKVVAAIVAAYTRPVVSILTNEKGKIIGDREINELDLCRYDTDEIILPLKTDFIRHNTMTGF
jgi:HD-GYP domain-containing protein (c-di-GMP phosphodiesterase class II)